MAHKISITLIFLCTILLFSCSDSTSPDDGLPPAPDPKDGFTFVENDSETNQEINAEAKTGSYAPVFKWKVGNKTVSLMDYRGMVVLIDFWKSHCPPCMQFAPILKSAWKRYKEQGLVVITIYYEYNHDLWLEHITKGGNRWVNLADSDQDNLPIARLYDVQYVPTLCIIDRSGIIKHLGIAFQSEEELAAAIEEVI
jgi:thiol-disulfide isomerase/thioredoxin